VNGKSISGVKSGSFASIRRTWSDGDRVDLELPMPLRLEPVDAQHANQVALLRGPLALFAIAESQPSFDKGELLRATLTKNSTGDSIAKSTSGKPISIRPFMNIKEESYSTYVQLRS
jgi:uncharacterized protein